MDYNNKELTNSEIFKLGLEVGRKQLADHIQYQFEAGKPAEINGELYWLKDARQNLIDIMEHIESIWNEEHDLKRFIIPIRCIHEERPVAMEVIIQAEDAQKAMLVALKEFVQGSRWDVNTNFSHYKQIKD